MARVPASGTQYTIQAGEYEAVIASVGASLRSLTWRGRDLVVPFDEDEVRPAYRGVTLVPWPNRVVDGQYTYDGVDYVLAHTEPDRGHALHGLAAWLDYTMVAIDVASVTLVRIIEPQSGYPWRLTIETTYALGADGLTQTVRAVNNAPGAAPFGTGPHPYLVAGPGTVDDWTLELPARQVLEVTEDRLIPTDLRSIVGDERFGYLEPRMIGAAEIDHAYTGLRRDEQGIATVRVTDASGSGVQMTWDERCPWVQIHTADVPAAPRLHRVGLAVEPMTCPPDAFNSGTDLIILEGHGGSAEASWTISAIA